jgi:hypothetical protein
MEMSRTTSTQKIHIKRTNLMIQLDVSHELSEYENLQKACSELNNFLPTHASILGRHPFQFTPGDRLVSEEFDRLNDNLRKATDAWYQSKGNL